jgi:hypothetical protein
MEFRYTGCADPKRRALVVAMMNLNPAARHKTLNNGVTWRYVQLSAASLLGCALKCTGYFLPWGNWGLYCSVCCQNELIRMELGKRRPGDPQDAPTFL